MLELLGDGVVGISLQLFSLFPLDNEEVVFYYGTGLLEFGKGLLCQLFADVIGGLHGGDHEGLIGLLDSQRSMDFLSSFEWFCYLFTFLLPFSVAREHC